MFVWKKDFELGIESIDLQHRKLFDIGNQLYDLVVAELGTVSAMQQAKVLVEELKAYTVYHFKTEEELFIKYRYPGFFDHKVEHDQFVTYIESIQLDALGAEQIVVLKELLGKLAQWIFNHIVTTDCLYRDYLMSLGAK